MNGRVMLHENATHFICKQHALSGETQPHRWLVSKHARLDESRKTSTVAIPPINPKLCLNFLQRKTLAQPQPREQHFFEVLLLGQRPRLRGGARAVTNSLNVVLRTGDDAPATPAACAVRATAERHPLAVAPVFQVVARLSSFARDV